MSMLSFRAMILLSVFLECTSTPAAGSWTQHMPSWPAKLASCRQGPKGATAPMKLLNFGIGRLAGPAAITKSTDSMLLRPGCCAQCAFRSGRPWRRWLGTAWAPSSLPRWIMPRSRAIARGTSRTTGRPRYRRWTGTSTPVRLDLRDVSSAPWPGWTGRGEHGLAGPVVENSGHSMSAAGPLTADEWSNWYRRGDQPPNQQGSATKCSSSDACSHATCGSGNHTHSSPGWTGDTTLKTRQWVG
eukprot:6490972-Amphidinium_carterae.1